VTAGERTGAIARSTDGWDVVVTCGGTGGHVLPALALVDALVDEGVPRDRIGFVGGSTGIETRLVPDAGVELVSLDVRGLVRSRSVRGIVRNVGAVTAMGRAVLRARRVLRGHGTPVVVGMGGYASLPSVLAAPKGRVVLYESNAVPGLATRVGARRAALVATAFPPRDTGVTHAEQFGFLVRGAMRDFDRGALRADARRHYGVHDDRTVVAVVGGSQGAKSLNDAVVGLLARWRDRGDVAFVHLSGRRDADTVAAAAAAALGAGPTRVSWFGTAFEDDMARCFAAADLVVCRSGASTCAELAATGSAAVLVPYPHATDDHQLANARALVDAGAAELLDDAAVDADVLGAVLDALLADPDRVTAMRAAASRLGAVDGAKLLARRVVQLTDGSVDGRGPA
jgi:UDP-N-acetylglucosamine--N-acetylmuramyl-(pentapeptide) pyrophosphoryl-undecaprenol N-acetylglucosamine transferase